jgi:hypothetical protein
MLFLTQVEHPVMADNGRQREAVSGADKLSATAILKRPWRNGRRAALRSLCSARGVPVQVRAGARRGGFRR